MNMSDIQCFIKVVECMSFSKAADALYISQQAVSLHIKHLEESYQVQLFERRPKLKLTHSGQLLLEAARDIIDRETALLEQFNVSKDFCTGDLSIGLPPNRSTPFVNEFIPVFSKSYPNMTVKLVEKTSARLPISILQNEIDLALILVSPSTLPYSERLDPDTFNIQPLETEDLYLVISDGLLAAHFPERYPGCAAEFAKGVSLFELSKIPMFLHPDTSRLHESIYNKLLQNGTPPFIRIKTTLTSSLLSLCEQGYGIFFSNLMSLKYLYDMQRHCFDNLWIFPVLEFQNTRQTLLIHHRKKRLTRPMSDSIGMIRTLYQNHLSVMDTLLSGSGKPPAGPPGRKGSRPGPGGAVAAKNPD